MSDEDDTSIEVSDKQTGDFEDTEVDKNDSSKKQTVDKRTLASLVSDEVAASAKLPKLSSDSCVASAVSAIRNVGHPTFNDEQQQMSDSSSCRQMYPENAARLQSNDASDEDNITRNNVLMNSEAAKAERANCQTKNMCYKVSAVIKDGKRTYAINLVDTENTDNLSSKRSRVPAKTVSANGVVETIRVSKSKTSNGHLVHSTREAVSNDRLGDDMLASTSCPEQLDMPIEECDDEDGNNVKQVQRFTISIVGLVVCKSLIFLT